MCNLSWTPHSNLEKDNSLQSCVSPIMGCLEYTRAVLRLVWPFDDIVGDGLPYCCSLHVIA